ncbi:MAG TPA: protein kinase [Drouetiella sp.]
MPSTVNPEHIERNGLNQYEILGVIARGGMGIVYKARSLALGNEVAIKMLETTSVLDQRRIDRFHREAKILSQLDHPSIVRLLNFGFSQSEQPYMVLEYIDGPTLPEYLAWNRRPELQEFRSIFMDIANALAYAHRYGVLHRDLKPSNIMLKQQDDGRYIPKIIDFGISKILGDDDGALTRTGEVIGTVAYMSPEQIGGGQVDERSDIYSLGCVFFEALTGVPPYNADTQVDLIFQQLNAPTPTLESKCKKTFAPELNELVIKALDKDPAKRFASMEEFAEKLSEVRLRPRTKLEKTLTVKFFLIIASVLLLFIIANVLLLGLLQIRAEENNRNAEVHYESARIQKNQQAFLGADSMDPNEIAANLIRRSHDEKSFNLRDEVNDAVLKNFAYDNFPNIWELQLENASVKGPGLAYVVRLPIQRLYIERSAITDRGMMEIGRMRNLRYLNLDSCAITAKGFSYIANCPVADLSANAIHLTDEGLKYISEIKTLTDLALQDNPELTDVGVASLINLKNLNTISFRRAIITTPMLEKLTEIVSLRRLYLFDTHTTDEQIKLLVKHPNWTELILESQTELTSGCFRYLATLKHLNKLELKYTKNLRDQDFKYLAPLKGIIEFGIQSTNAGDGAVPFINNIEPTMLCIQGSKITDKGLLQLAQNQRLKRVEVVGDKTPTPGITFDGVKKFIKLRPDVDIRYADENHNIESVEVLKTKALNN